MQIVNLSDVPEHLEKVVLWYHNEWNYLNPQKTYEMRLEEMRTHIKGQKIPQTWLAITDKVVGAATIVASDMDNRLEFTPWLGNVYVEKDARGLGVGRELVKQIMNYARELGYQQMYLYTPDKAHFYLNMNWQVVEETTYHNASITIMKFIL